jgi:hypothetical protein
MANNNNNNKHFRPGTRQQTAFQETEADRKRRDKANKKMTNRR